MKLCFRMSNFNAIAIAYTWKWLIQSLTAVDEIRLMWLWLSLTQNFWMLLLLLSLIKILKLKFGIDLKWCVWWWGLVKNSTLGSVVHLAMFCWLKPPLTYSNEKSSYIKSKNGHICSIAPFSKTRVFSSTRREGRMMTQCFGWSPFSGGDTIPFCPLNPSASLHMGSENLQHILYRVNLEN